MPPIKANVSWLTKTIYFYEIQKGKCYYCEISLWNADQKDIALDCDFDYKTPISRGGSKTSMDNLCLSCKSCNNTKSDLTEHEYRVALKAVAEGKIQRKDLIDYGKYISLKTKFGSFEKDNSYDKGRNDRTKEIIELAESMKVLLDVDEFEFEQFDEGRNIGLQQLIKSITPHP